MKEMKLIAGPLLRLQKNRWERPADIGAAWFDESGRLLVSLCHPWRNKKVDPEYVANVCDVLGIEKPETP